MECEKCEKSAVMDAFSSGNCQRCKEEIHTAHTPCDCVCELCSEKHHLCQSCGNEIIMKKTNWVTPKEIIGLSELKTEYDYIQTLKKYIGSKKRKDVQTMPFLSNTLNQIVEYSEWLHKTKLTEAMFQEGGLFEGFKRKYAGYDVEYSSDTHAISFDGLHCVYCEGEETYPVIQTLADLARLTAKHPLKLR